MRVHKLSFVPSVSIAFLCADALSCVTGQVRHARLSHLLSKLTHFALAGVLCCLNVSVLLVVPVVLPLDYEQDAHIESACVCKWMCVCMRICVCMLCK